MHIIDARNVNDAWPKAVVLMDVHGEPEDSRNGRVVVTPFPVTTIYRKPLERVLFDPVRDANPIFHLHEALWMLAGDNNARWLDQFVKDFSARYADDGGTQHGAYGYRWRKWFENPRSYIGGGFDQLDEVVRVLREDPESRQAVIQMWDAETDLGVKGLKDRPCNTQIYLRVRRETRPIYQNRAHERVLDVTVTCRSNDIVWGCYGTNVVHFSILQEYLAARVGVGVGMYYQVSNNWHMYEATAVKINERFLTDSWGMVEYPETRPLVDVPESFDDEVRQYVEDPGGSINKFQNRFLVEVAQPMFLVNLARRDWRWKDATQAAEAIVAPDWRQATLGWLGRRLAGEVERRMVMK